jgi:hypothetical protein
MLTAMAWPSNGLSGVAYVGRFKSIPEVLGTSGIAWTRCGAVSWREGDAARTLRAGGLKDSYTSVLTGVVNGKGKLVFTYAFNSWTWLNAFSFYVNGKQQIYRCYDNGIVHHSGTVTNEVTSSGTTRFSWMYAVADASRDYGTGYASQAGVWLSGVRWIPEVPDTVEVEGVAVPSSWLDGFFPGQGGSATAYEALAQADSDGDGFPNWQEYLLGTNPGSRESRFSVTVRMEDGELVFGWSPTNANMQALGYRYVPKGRTSLDDAAGWVPYVKGHRFFKVVVEPVD